MIRSWLLCLLSLLVAANLYALDASVKVLQEPGFPTADTSSLSPAQVSTLLAGATFVSAEKLDAALSDPRTSLLVLPYGSAFPEADWSGIKAYLDRGGNLLVIGGRPFTRAAFKENGAWKLREYSVRFIRELRVDQFQQTSGSAGYAYLPNPAMVTQLPAFPWQRAFSPILHLSSSRVSDRLGSAGRIDARIDALAWGARDGHRLSAPVVQIDHLRESFAGGRWIWMDADLPASFGNSSVAKAIVDSLVAAAERGAQDFEVNPVYPLYLPGEPIQLNAQWIGRTGAARPLSVRLTVTSEDTQAAPFTRTFSLSGRATIIIPAPAGKGLYRIDAELLDGASVIARYRSGFWMRDLAYLDSGPELSVNHNYFEVNGKPLAVIGTTYMSSRVQRLFFAHPNVYVWNQDLGQIQAAGLNMIRSGWWSGWDKLCDENGVPNEHTLRTLEAFLMTARRHRLPVQFNVFAFLPDVLGGENAYLDPVAVRREENLYTGLARRFGKVPYLAWDLINEPSFGHHLWTARPNGDPIEAAQWNAWLKTRYASRAALENAWNLPTTPYDTPWPVPTAADWSANSGAGSLRLYDFYLFSQQKFAAWVAQIRQAIHSTGSQQLITVGQDEGGNTGRLLPTYFSGSVDFTTNHSWFQVDGLLWNSMVAKQHGKPMLIQETGVGAGTNPDQIARQSLEDQAGLLERKLALSFAEGDGAIEWLWNTNADMLEDGEVSLGGIRADGTEKPEIGVMRGFAAFAKAASPSFVDPVQPEVAIVTSEAAQFSTSWATQMNAQRKAVRALTYGSRVTGYLVGESRIAGMGNPRLAILPSPQALGDAGWQALLAYVKNGGTLLVTGAVQRDDHWHGVDRLATVGLRGSVEPLTFRTATLTAGDESIPMSFDQSARSALESVRFADGSTLESKAYGRGHIFWAAYPVELSNNPDAAARLYSYVLRQVGITPAFDDLSSLPPGVLVYPTVLRDAVLYIFASGDAADTPINLRDKTTGARIHFKLRSRHAAVVLLNRKDGSVVASYGFHE
ncbi:MAG: hypothetical protein WAM66_09090 [Acidobacteriaceae bacterium]